MWVVIGKFLAGSWISIAIYAAIFAAGGVAGGKVGQSIGKHQMQSQVDDRDQTIKGLHKQIDDPNTGYVRLLGDASAQIARATNNTKSCQSVLDQQNKAIAALKEADAKSKTEVSRTLQDLKASQASADQLVKAIQFFKPTSNACADAETILRGLGK